MMLHRRIIMRTSGYTEEARRSDFHFFEDNQKELFEKYGECYLAIKNKEIIGNFNTITDALESLSKEYAPGTYSLQRCSGSANANRVRIQRMAIGA